MDHPNSDLPGKINQLYAKVNALSLAVKGGSLADQHFEREYYRDFPTCAEEMPDFRDRFLALIRGLDEKSTETVVLALNRLRALKSSPVRELPLFSEAETERILKMQALFEREQIRLSENCFFYRGYMLPSPRFEPCVFVDRCGVNELEHPERFLDRDIIDAGAYIGDSALILSGLTRRKVYAFEPTKENYDYLLKTIAMNQLTNVVPEPYALGREKGTAEMTNAVVSSTNAYVEKSTMPYLSTETAEVTTLDDFVRENDLHVGLIKVDVEGAEQLLLAGALDTIRTQKPALLFSIYHNASDFYEIKPMLEALDLGYRFKIRHPGIDTVLMETMLIAETDA